MKKFIAVICCLLSTSVFASDFANQLKGKRLVLDGAVCAGWEFTKSGKFADWRNEADCAMTTGDYKSRWRVQWLDNDHVIFVETQRTNEGFPPRTFVYQILNIKGNSVKAKEYWTGWGNTSTEIQTFTLIK